MAEAGESFLEKAKSKIAEVCQDLNLEVETLRTLRTKLFQHVGIESLSPEETHQLNDSIKDYIQKRFNDADNNDVENEEKEKGDDQEKQLGAEADKNFDKEVSITVENKEESSEEEDLLDETDDQENDESIDNEKSTETKKKKRKRDNSKIGKASEEKIKRLKNYIAKCGVRKKWAKELENMSGPQQIQHLQGILDELGMEGRPTLDKCKKIRKKIEIENELRELQKSGLKDSSDEEEAEEEEKEEEQDEVLTRRRQRISLASIGDPEDDD